MTKFNEQTEEVTVGKTIENTYTELQVREAIIKAFDYHHINGHLPEIAILNIIESLKQPKKEDWSNSSGFYQQPKKD